MRRTAYRQEDWVTLPAFGPVISRPLDEKPPPLIAFPSCIAELAPNDEWMFPSDGSSLRIKVLNVDTSTRIGALTLAVGRGPDYEGRAVITAPIRRRTIAPRRLSRGMRRHIRRMKAARPYAIATE